MKGSRVSALALLITALSSGCEPSGFLRKENVTYNFEDEGFLSGDVLQTRGTARPAVPDAPEQGDAGAVRLCGAAAERDARRRALRVLLHTYFEIPPRSGVTTPGVSDFDRDYPHTFTERDLIRAEIDFRGLLDRGFIALQDNRSRDACIVVYRIEGRDLPSEIRTFSLTFVPEQTPWRQKPHQDSLQPAESSTKSSRAPSY